MKERKSPFKPRHLIYFLVLLALAKIFSLKADGVIDQIFAFSVAAFGTYFLVLVEKIYLKGFNDGLEEWLGDLDDISDSKRRSSVKRVKLYLVAAGVFLFFCGALLLLPG